MITIPTVIVLGAGASCGLGFPTGRGLRDNICNLLLSSDLKDALPGTAFPEKTVREFRNAFWKSGTYSIDEFLERRPEFVEIGKAAIARCLMVYEDLNSPRLYSHDNWYHYLFDQLKEGCKKATDLTQNKLAIVTFNYDRSLDEFLFNATKHLFGLSDPDAATIVNGIPIFHVHGSLGRLPWQTGKEPERLYVGALTADNLRKAASGIRILHEKHDCGPIAVAINQAERTLFLGFGYHESSLLKILAPKLKHHLWIGMARSIPLMQRQQITSSWGIRFPSFGRYDMEPVKDGNEPPELEIEAWIKTTVRLTERREGFAEHASFAAAARGF